MPYNTSEKRKEYDKQYWASHKDKKLQYSKTYYQKHRQKLLEKQRLAKEGPENRLKHLVKRAKVRARSSGIPFDISVEDLSTPEKCPVLGLILNYGFGNSHSPNRASLDRIIPEKGYVKGNVRVISLRANVLKRDATIEELQAVTKDYQYQLEQLHKICAKN